MYARSRLRSPIPPPIGFAAVREGGIIFETGRPVTFPFVHNTERAPNFGARYGQDIEPAGYYCLHSDQPPPRGWTSGTMSFRKPLVLRRAFDENDIFGPTGWKARLHLASNGKKRKALTTWLTRQGFDGVVTIAHGGTGEIVALKPKSSIR